MNIVAQAAALILSMVCMGQATILGTNKLDKVLYTLMSFAFLVLCFIAQGVL